MANLVKPHWNALDPYYFHVFSDWINDQSDIEAIDTITDTGTVTIGDAAGGIVALVPSDGTVADNDEAYVATPNEVFKFAAGKPIWCEAYVQFTEANTDDANVAFGMANAVAANLLVDDGAGLRTSGSIIAFLKVDGETVWRCVSRCNATLNSTTSTATAGGAAYQRLQIECVDRDPTYFTVVFKVDDQYCKDTNGSVIRHTLPFASSTEMSLFLGVKNGGANLETLNCDWWSASQTR
jgi:hypothetical protein